jgi:hypothetical protein
MQKIVFLIMVLVVTTATKAQELVMTVNGGDNDTLLQPAGSYI